MLREIEEARDELIRRTTAADHLALAVEMTNAGISIAECLDALAAATEESPDGEGRLTTLRARLGRQETTPGDFERYILALAALQALDRLDSEALPARVKRLCAGLFRQWACTPPQLDSGNRLVAFAKIATLRRLPAGLFDWETSGLPRSWIPRIRPLRQLLRTLRLVGDPTRPFRPVFFAHLTVCRPIRAMLPADAQRSYHLIARSLEMHPEVKALVTASWFHSPDTRRVSPHLSWLNQVFLEHGGIVATIGKADPGCGVLNRSPERQAAFEAGRFTPTEGLVIWPRDAMLAWARRHPELEAA